MLTVGLDVHQAVIPSLSRYSTPAAECVPPPVHSSVVNVAAVGRVGLPASTVAFDQEERHGDDQHGAGPAGPPGAVR